MSYGTCYVLPIFCVLYAVFYIFFLSGPGQADPFLADVPLRARPDRAPLGHAQPVKALLVAAAAGAAVARVAQQVPVQGERRKGSTSTVDSGYSTVNHNFKKSSTLSKILIGL